MCFSAPASFIASGGLAALGCTALTIARKEERILAAIPLLFAIQQAFEGVQWIYLGAGSSSLFAGYGFLFFALIIWPAFVPALVFAMDKEGRSFLKWFSFLGLGVSIYFIALLAIQPLALRELNACVSYSFFIPFEYLAVPAYLAAVFGPLFLSAKKIFRLFGVLIAVLALVSWLFYSQAFISVWCFFAAIVSCVFFFSVRREGSREEIPSPVPSDDVQV